MRKTLSIIVCKLFFSFVLAGQDIYDRNILVQFYQNTDYSGAVAYLLPYSGRATNTIQFNNDLGYSYFMNEQYDEALSLFRQVHQLQPSNNLASQYMALIFSEKKETDSTLFYYKNLNYYYPSNYRFWQKAAQVFYMINEIDSARYYYEKGYKLNPRSGSLVVQFTDVLIRQKELGKADTLINNFLAVDSSSREVIAKRVDLSYRRGDHASVIAWGEKLLRDSADVLAPYINLAFSYLGVDSLDKCINLCEWLTLKKKNTQALMYCEAQAYAKKKQYDRSNELLDECLKQSLQDDAVRYFNAKADNYEAMKQYNKSVNYYDTSYYIFQNATDLYYAGRIYDKYFKNKAKASSYYRRFIEKRKTPRNTGEVAVFEYIRQYLQEIKDNR